MLPHSRVTASSARGKSFGLYWTRDALLRTAAAILEPLFIGSLLGWSLACSGNVFGYGVDRICGRNAIRGAFNHHHRIASP